VQGIDLELPEIKEGKTELAVGTPEGETDAAFLAVSLKGEGYPTIIYHHGSGEHPFDFGRFSKNTFKNILVDTDEPVEANIIAVRAPFHGASLKLYREKISHLSSFVLMLSVSVVLIDKLAAAVREKFGAPVVVAGISLGGWAANLHRAYFNSADIYIPMLAGAALGELFISSSYRRLVGRCAREKPEVLREVLNFEDDFLKVADDNVFPLLGRYDQFIQYHRQKLCYPEGSINVLDKGHVTASIASGTLRDHILYAIEKWR
jgi:pimeloyl-ACP methyl ester carboxylesterase